jgi:hypothetical protein
VRYLILILFFYFNVFGAPGYIADGLIKWEASTDLETGIFEYRIFYAKEGSKIDTKKTPYVSLGPDILEYNVKNLPISGNIVFCIAARDGGWNVSDCSEQTYFLDAASPSMPVFKGITHFGQN